jgi:hypothetical protein
MYIPKFFTQSENGMMLPFKSRGGRETALNDARSLELPKIMD